MIISGALTRAQARKQRKQLMVEIEREHRRKDREKLAALRAQIADVKRRRKEAMHDAVARCRLERLAARERAKELRRVALEQLREAVRQEKLAAREACNLRKAEVRQSAATETEKARELLRAERDFQKQMRMLEGRAKQREREMSTARERRDESDHEVLQNLPDDLHPFFENIKHKVKGNDRISRTEVVLHLAEENPDLVVEAMTELSQRELAKLLAEEKRLAKAVRTRRRSLTADERAAIPF